MSRHLTNEGGPVFILYILHYRYIHSVNVSNIVNLFFQTVISLFFWLSTLQIQHKLHVCSF